MNSVSSVYMGFWFGIPAKPSARLHEQPEDLLVEGECGRGGDRQEEDGIYQASPQLVQVLPEREFPLVHAESSASGSPRFSGGVRADVLKATGPPDSVFGSFSGSADSSAAGSAAVSAAPA